MDEQVINSEDCVFSEDLDHTWITIKNFSIYIVEKNDGVKVEIYKRGEEDCEPINSIKVFDS
jgi:hypothetical protein